LQLFTTFLQQRRSSINFSFHINMNMPISNQKVVPEEQQTETSAQGDQNVYLEYNHPSDHQGAANGSVQVTTNLRLQQYESGEIESSAAADMDFWSPKTVAAGLKAMNEFGWLLEPAVPLFGSEFATPSNDLSNDIYHPYSSPQAEQQRSYDRQFFTDNATVNNVVPVPSGLVTMASLERRPHISEQYQPFTTVRRSQTIMQPFQPVPRDLHSMVSPAQLSLSQQGPTNQPIAETQAAAVETVPSSPTRLRRARQSEQTTQSQGPRKATKGNGHIEGFDRKTGETTLVGRYPAYEADMENQHYWICPDVRCEEDGMQPNWTTKNGYKYHLNRACLQNPSSDRSIYLALHGVDKYLVKNAKKSGFQETCMCKRQFKSQSGWDLHRNVNETTKNGRCLERLRNRGGLPNQLQENEEIPDELTPPDQ
jgi:hypothetical protein